MNSDRKKVFLVSVLVFLLSGGAVSMFFIMRGVEDLKDRPGFSSEFSSFPRKVMFSMMKAVDFVDAEKADVKLAEFARKVTDVLFPELSTNSSSPEEQAEKLYPSNHRASSSKPYMPSEKIKSSIPSPSSGLGSGSKTTGSSGSFAASSNSRGFSVSGSLSDTVGKSAQSKQLLARLQYMSSNIKEGLRSGSASQAKYKWDRSFVGSMSAGKKGIYSGGAVNLDKIRGEVIDLKAAETNGLKSPTPGEPMVDNPNSKQTEDLKKSVMDQMKQDMSKGLVNSMFSGLNSSSGSGAEGTDGQDGKNTQFKQEDFSAFDKASREYAFPGEEVLSSKNASCENMPTLCSNAGVSGDVMVSVYPNGDSLVMANQGGKSVLIGCYAASAGCVELPKN